MTQPKTLYARSGDAHLAYQVVGDGPLDLVLVPGLVSHIEIGWETPPIARFFRRLASFARLILYDKRGTGLSDRCSVLGKARLEQGVDDVRAVLDAVGSGRAALFGWSEGGAMSIMFSATHPERTAALILYSAYARPHKEGFGWRHFGVSDEEALEWLLRASAKGDDLHLWAPSIADNPRHREAWARAFRYAASPGTIREIWDMTTSMDVTAILPAVRVPTLVMHRRDEVLIDVSNGRYIAERIPGAKFVELQGRDHLFWVGDQDSILNAMQEFLTGVKPAPERDRVLATVLFVDIVGSTETAVRLGDRAWQDVLERYRTTVRNELTRFRGQELDTAGDGFVTTFDGPSRAVRCALSIRDAAREMGVAIRAGAHTGEVELAGDKPGGVALHIGARIASIATAGEILASGTVKDLTTGSAIGFTERGMHALKGVPGEWRLYAAS